MLQRDYWDYADYVHMRDECVLEIRQMRLLGWVPPPKNSGVVKIIVKGLTPAIRNSGIIHPRNTISSEAGP